MRNIVFKESDFRKIKIQSNLLFHFANYRSARCFYNVYVKIDVMDLKDEESLPKNITTLKTITNFRLNWNLKLNFFSPHTVTCVILSHVIGTL